MSKASQRREIEIGVREFRANLSRYLAQVAGGTDVTITDRGHPVARLVGVDRETIGLRRLAENGRVRLPARPATDPGTWRRPKPTSPVADLVRDQRR